MQHLSDRDLNIVQAITTFLPYYKLSLMQLTLSMIKKYISLLLPANLIVAKEQ